MRLTVVTPLFPPDVHDVANYHKDLVERLAREHTVTVALFGKLPEQIPKVTFTTIDKRAATYARLWHMFRTLLALRNATDWFVVTNGPSTELPALVLTFFTRKPLLLLNSDSVANTGVYRFIHMFFTWRAHASLSAVHILSSLTKPEIHPLIVLPVHALSNYETIWNKHMSDITDHLTHDAHH